jgi:hypothetical protein
MPKPTVPAQQVNTQIDEDAEAAELAAINAELANSEPLAETMAELAAIDSALAPAAFAAPASPPAATPEKMSSHERVAAIQAKAEERRRAREAEGDSEPEPEVVGAASPAGAGGLSPIPRYEPERAPERRDSLAELARRLRKTLSWPRSWANFSLF